MIIQPLFHLWAVHSFGLAFMVDAIAGGLSHAGCSKAPPDHGGNGFMAIAIKIDDFIPLLKYEQEVEGLIDWVKSSAKLPGRQIYIPGEIEQQNRGRMMMIRGIRSCWLMNRSGNYPR